jgi:hypothetical protein
MMDFKKLIIANKDFLQVAAIIIVVIGVLYYFNYASESMSDQVSFSPLAGQPSDEGYFDKPAPEVIEGDYAYPITSPTYISPVEFTHGGDELTPSDLLPTSESEFEAGIGGGFGRGVTGESDEYNGADLSTKNFLVSGFNIGINSQGNTNKNANRQLRSDPIIPQNMNATPFSQSTLGPDLTRKQFEIGGAGC